MSESIEHLTLDGKRESVHRLFEQWAFALRQRQLHWVPINSRTQICMLETLGKRLGLFF